MEHVDPGQVDCKDGDIEDIGCKDDDIWSMAALIARRMDTGPRETRMGLSRSFSWTGFLTLSVKMMVIRFTVYLMSCAGLRNRIVIQS